MRNVAEELYFRASNARSAEERKAIKGVQHAIEDVLKRYGEESFDRPKPSLRYKDWYKRQNHNGS